jgi:nickel/cobalt transporter (NicO) family protein
MAVDVRERHASAMPLSAEIHCRHQRTGAYFAVTSTRAAYGFAATCVLVGAFVSPAYAHPLGSVSINRYAGIRVADREVELEYLLDFAELPAYAEIELLDRDHDGAVTLEERERYLDELEARIGLTLSLSVNGTRAPLRRSSRRLLVPPGQDGLSTLLVAIGFRAESSTGGGDVTVDFEDRTFASRAGWREIDAIETPDIQIVDRSPPATGSRAGARLTYPSTAAQSPVREDQVTIVFRPRSAAVAMEPALGLFESLTARTPQSSRLADLVRRPEQSLAFLVFALALAFALGAGHALTPGHGKALVGAYLIGEHSRTRDALILALAVTVSHTASVFVLGLAALTVEQTLGTDRLLVALEVGSGLLVIAIAARQLPTRIRLLRHVILHRGWARRPVIMSSTPLVASAANAASTDRHDHEPPHGHGHGSDHEHGGGHVHAPPGLGWRGLVTLGVSGGIVPCPGALVVLLTAVSLHRLALGLALITAFSLGLAAVLAGLGLLFVYARTRLDGLLEGGLTVRALPVASSVIVLALGLGIVLRGLVG